ncbi:cell division protein FtsQ/DivIB [Fibrobacterota bacterium]
MIAYSIGKKKKPVRRKRLAKTSPRKTRKKRNKAKKVFKKAFTGLKYTVTAALILGVIGAAAGGTYRLYKSNDVLILRDVVLEGNRYFSRHDLVSILQLELGVKLLGIPVEQLEQSLRNHPWIESADIRRHYPSRLKIILREKRPVALCFGQDGKTGKRETAHGKGEPAGKQTDEWFGVSGNGEYLPDIPFHNINLPVIDMMRGKAPPPTWTS